MSGLLSVATGALNANQAVLQTTGNNIANVNTPGYSRQSAVLQTIQGQFSGGGYIGKGVALTTIQRNYSEFLTRQAALASATSAGDAARSDKLTQLEGIFSGGADGLGAAISDTLNSFSDVASAPTDLTARTVTLTKIDETASRMRAASQSLDDLQSATSQEISQKIDAINTLAKNIAGVNDQITKAQGSGQAPNDLLDQRDQLVRDLNQYIQTTSIPATDGSVGIFIGGSQALVLGTSAATLKLGTDDYSDPSKSKLAIVRSGQSITLDENTLGGGSVPGLLRFQNTDLTEGRNLLGRLTLAVSTSMNDQQKLGLDLNGTPGGNLFTPTDLNAAGTILTPTNQAASAGLSLSIADTSQFAASDYEVIFTGPADGNITRKSDGVVTTFTTLPVTIDGLTISAAASANVGDHFLLKPFSNSASNISAEFSTPRSLAVASPIVGKMGSANTGSLQLSSLLAKTNTPTPPQPTPVVLAFTSANSYTINGVGPNTYQSGQVIQTADWNLVLQGSPKAGDSFTVVGIQDTANNNGVDYKLNGGNAAAMMTLRDAAMFDGSALTDGYASMIAQIGVRAQSATYAANVSSSIATNLETQRTAVSGVNLDEEAAKLIQYQQAYQASAKVIQIAQSIFNTLIQTMS